MLRMPSAQTVKTSLIRSGLKIDDPRLVTQKQMVLSPSVKLVDGCEPLYKLMMAAAGFQFWTTSCGFIFSWTRIPR